MKYLSTVLNRYGNSDVISSHCSHNYITMTKTKLIARDGLAWWQSMFQKHRCNSEQRYYTASDMIGSSSVLRPRQHSIGIGI